MLLVWCCFVFAGGDCRNPEAEMDRQEVGCQAALPGHMAMSVLHGMLDSLCSAVCIDAG